MKLGTIYYKVQIYFLNDSSDFAKNILISFSFHHKLNGSQFGNNNHVKFDFHRFVWNKHGCHSSTCVV
jgi:hypothetical protein